MSVLCPQALAFRLLLEWRNRRNPFALETFYGARDGFGRNGEILADLFDRERLMERERVLILDTSLRDGEQAPGCSMNIKEKLLLARKLQLLGVDIIEAGFPVASPGEAEAVRLIAGEIEGPIIAAFARCTEKDIQAAWNAL